MTGISIVFPEDTVKQQIDEIELDYSLRSLLKRKVVITGITVRNPELQVYQRQDGELNIMRLISRKSSSNAGKDTVKIPVRFNINKVNIYHASGNFHSHKFQISMTGCDVNLNNIAVNRDLKFTSDFDFRDLSGLVTIHGKTFEIGFDVEGEGKLENDGGKFTTNSILHLLSQDTPVVGFNIFSAGTMDIPQRKVNFDSLLIDEILQEKLEESFNMRCKGYVEDNDSTIIINIASEAVEYKIGMLSAERGMRNALKFITPVIPEFSLLSIEPSKMNFRGSYYKSSGAYSLEAKIENHFWLGELVYEPLSIKLDGMETINSVYLFLTKDSLKIRDYNIEFERGEVEIQLSDDVVHYLSNIEGSIFSEKGNEYADFAFDGPFKESIDGCLVFNLPQNMFDFKPNPAMVDSFLLEIDNICPLNYGFSHMEGDFDAAFLLHNQGRIRVSANLIADDSVFYVKDAERYYLPVDTMSGKGWINIADIRNISFEEFQVNISDWAEFYFASNLFEDSVVVFIDSSIVDLGKLSQRFKYLFSGELISELNMNGYSCFSLKDPINSNLSDFEFVILPTDIKAYDFDIEGFQSDFHLLADGYNLSGDGEAFIPAIYFKTFRPHPFEDIKVSLEAEGNYNTKSLIFDAQTQCLSESITLSSEGSLSFSSKDRIFYTMEIAGCFSDSSYIEIHPKARIKGNASCELQIEIDSSAFFSGECSFDGFNVEYSGWEVNGVGGRMPLVQEMLLNPFGLVKKTQESLIFPFYVDYRPYLTESNLGYVDNIRIDTVVFAGHKMSGFTSDLSWEHGYLLMPYFQMTLFEGNLAGKGWFRVDSLMMGKVTYSLAAQGAEINSDMISNIKLGTSRDSRISFNLDFTGRQSFDPDNPDFDLQGSLHITKISPQVAENLLLTLDPQQKDSGIRSALYFLKRGWGIQSFSFRTSHGLVYSTIITQQPLLSKPIPYIISRFLPLEKEITLSRLPLKFFLK